MNKICNVCLIEKNVNEFYKRGKTYRNSCKECKDKKDKIYRQNNREKYRQSRKIYEENNRERINKYRRELHTFKKLNDNKYSIRKIISKYKLPVSEYLKMIEEQNNKCSICKNEQSDKHPNGEFRKLNVDHCHKTGKIRGLLCGKCNRMLGLARDDLNILNNAISYLSEKL